MRIRLTSVSIDNYDKALTFYTEVLGFREKQDESMGHGTRLITLVSPEEPNGAELLLEPSAGYPPMRELRKALVRDGIPLAAFEVDDVQSEYERLKGRGVVFTAKPRKAGSETSAIFDDTCGNLIQIYAQE
jgi:catechol 2,3-dioxygenase-like lactoylglutathione lyase family enzyme